MKRVCFLILAVLMLSTCVLSSCGDDGDSSFVISNSTSEDISDESVSSDVESSNNDSSTTVSSEVENTSSEEAKDDLPENAVRLLFTRYTQNPTFVMIGTCAQGAKVTATIGTESLTVDSYMGWFEMSFTKTGKSHRVTFTQEVDGVEVDEPRTYFAKPTEPPSSWTWAFGSNNAFQFFIEKMIEDFEGNNLYGNNVITGMTSRVKSRIEQIREYNEDAEIIYMIVPSVLTTYPELAPDFLTKGSGQTRLDQVTDGLKKAGATVIDLRNVFKLHKNDEMPLYYKLDSHWADYGAYLGYKELFDHISKKFPSAKPREVDEFKWTADYYISADACLYLGIEQEKVKEYAYYREFDFEDVGNITKVPRYRGMQLIYNDLTTEEKVFKTDRSELPSCVVYRDSYCAGIYDILPERMNNTHYIGMWNYAWQKNLMQTEKPDYVIYLIAEWNMDEIVYN
ncbi:MAG: hypothetical protein J6Q89_06775 [Clostridia bacterium]|nr:hypothetical protein [Clostridia bacterium]